MTGFSIWEVLFLLCFAVTWLYLFNALLVATDMFLYFLYIGRNRRELGQQKQK